MNAPFAPSCPLPSSTESDVIELAHGGGGLLTQRLLNDIFRPAFASAPADLTHDGAILDNCGTRFAFTTDSYVVRPLFFPGGDIGSLAVNGTVNDLAMCGAQPLYLSAGFILEEGFPLADLRRIVRSMQGAAAVAGVRIVTGDTKVVERGKGDGLYISTAGVGRVLPEVNVAPQNVRAGDVVLLSADIGRHGIAIMSVREGLAFESPIESDCAPLASTVMQLIEAKITLHCLRDLTRGGLATGLAEIASTAGVCIRVQEHAITVSEPVRGACEILGLDPLYIANEGCFVAVLAAEHAALALSILQKAPGGSAAAVIGNVVEGDGNVILENGLGTCRVLDLLTGEQLPRIC